MFCAGCGKELEPGASGCRYCGRETGAAALPGRDAARAPEGPPPPRGPAGGCDSPAVSTGEWFVTLLLLGIPVVNLVLLLVWAFGGSASPSKRGFSRAVLIFTLIAVVVWLISFAAGLALFTSDPELKETVLRMLGG